MKKDKLDRLIKKVEDTKKLMQETGASALKEMFQEFFSTHPEVRSVVWAQYTPYFNDGEPCVFSVGELDLRINHDKVAADVLAAFVAEASVGEDEDAGYGSFSTAFQNIADTKENRRSKASGWNKNTLRDLTPDEQLLLNDFDEIRTAFGSDVMSSICEVVFGDHVRVVAKHDGFETFSYEHD